ncbi:MAG: RNA polymerase sigma factor [Planctomycetota bacterium]|nr:RNA polymerase sigma factor [Planctomycetota bacterium]
MRPHEQMSLLEERRLADGAIGGDADAVRALWHAHRRWIAAILLAHKPREAELDDLLQEVAVLITRNIATLNDPAAVKPWLRTIAINVARSTGRRQRVAGKALPVLAGSARRTAERQEREEVGDDSGRRALDLASALPPEYREPLLLRAVRGLSYRQIADVMGVPMTTIETRLARARRMLKEQLDALEAPKAGADRSSS